MTSQIGHDVIIPAGITLSAVKKISEELSIKLLQKKMGVDHKYWISLGTNDV